MKKNEVEFLTALRKVGFSGSLCESINDIRKAIFENYDKDTLAGMYLNHILDELHRSNRSIPEWNKLEHTEEELKFYRTALGIIKGWITNNEKASAFDFTRSVVYGSIKDEFGKILKDSNDRANRNREREFIRRSGSKTKLMMDSCNQPEYERKILERKYGITPNNFMEDALEEIDRVARDNWRKMGYEELERMLKRCGFVYKDTELFAAPGGNRYYTGGNYIACIETLDGMVNDFWWRLDSPENVANPKYRKDLHL